MQKEPAAEWIRLDFEQARTKHLLFKARLRSFIYGAQINEAPVVSHLECTVGKWLYSHALQAYGGIPEIHRLEHVHKELHVKAQTLVQIYKMGRVEEARRQLHGVEEAAAEINDLLSVVEAKVQQGGPGITPAVAPSHALQVNLAELQELLRLNEDLDRRIRQQSQDLFNAKERFELVAQATQDTIWDWNLGTNALWWNEGIKEMFGYSFEELEPNIESWYSRLHPDDKDRVVKSIHEVIDQGGKHWSSEYRFCRKDGSYAIVLDRAYVLHDDSGTPLRMLGSMQDITVRTRLEEAARESEARTRLALESARMGTYEINLDTQTIVYSSRTTEIFGLNPEQQWPYTAFTGAVHPDDLEVRQKAHEVARQTGELLYEVRILWPDGTLRWIRLNGSLLRQNGVPYLIGTVLDITEEKEAAVLLEQKIEERTAELQAANQQLKQFSYAASHDLQEPLRKITFFIDRLLSSLGPTLSEDNKRMADRIYHTANRMRHLIDDLLTYSNTTLGTTAFAEVDLSATVQEVLDDMEAVILQKGATVEVSELPRVQGDARQLKQLLQNLVGNALKYHKKDEAPQVTLHSRTVRGADKAEHVPAERREECFHLVEVKHAGIGFHPGQAKSIFGLFHRLHGKSEYEGTGVGLAIVEKVVENHQGYIWAESLPGEGSTFSVLLPAE